MSGRVGLPARQFGADPHLLAWPAGAVFLSPAVGAVLDGTGATTDRVAAIADLHRAPPFLRAAGSQARATLRAGGGSTFPIRYADTRGTHACRHPGACCTRGDTQDVGRWKPTKRGRA